MRLKSGIAAVLLSVQLGASAWADGTLYTMRVDGLACPYCAYGVEKKLKAVEGVRPESIEVDLNKGVVRVQVQAGVTLTASQMSELFNDAGFTLRGMKDQPL